MTNRKSMQESGASAEIAAGIAHCHSWLTNNAPPPRVLVGLTPEAAANILAAARQDPRRLVELGSAEGEEPSSKVGLVRSLLRAQLAVEDRELLAERLRGAREAGDPRAFLLDDTKSREAVPVLEGVLDTLEGLWKEALWRHEELPRFGLESEPNLRTLALVDASGTALKALIRVLRGGALGVDAPRSLAELVRFRTAWTARLREAGFSYEEIPPFLGGNPSRDPSATERLKGAMRRARARARKRGAAIKG